MADLIEVAELDTGKRDLQVRAPAPAADAGRGTKSLRRRGRGKADSRRGQGIRGSVVVHADRRAVRTILDNLLSNALRYTPATAKSCWLRKRSRTLCSSPSAIPAAASRPTG